METYIALLLMIIPGFISRKIYELLNKERKRGSDFEETIIALIFSVFVLALNCIFLISKYDIYTIKHIVTLFGSTKFILIYIWLTLISSIIIGVGFNFIKPILMFVINWIRKKKGNNKINIENSVWDLVFDDGKKHAVLIQKDEKEYAKGLISKYSSYVNSTELYLIQNEMINENPKYFNKFKGTYIDFDKNIKILEYDITQLLNDIKK